MSLLSMMFSNWGESFEQPRLELSLKPEGLLFPLETNVLIPRSCGSFLYRHEPYLRSVAQNIPKAASAVQVEKNKFEVTLDVQQFAPEEVSVKAIGRNVVVEGKHDGEDEHGWVSRQFTRRYLIPEQCDIEQLKPTLSSDGVLTITVPKKELEPKNERIIEIQKIEQSTETSQKTTEKHNITNTKEEPVAVLEKDSVHQKLQEESIQNA